MLISDKGSKSVLVLAHSFVHLGLTVPIKKPLTFGQCPKVALTKQTNTQLFNTNQRILSNQLCLGESCSSLRVSSPLVANLTPCGYVVPHPLGDGGLTVDYSESYATVSVSLSSPPLDGTAAWTMASV